jgi:hypothetical protein
MTEDDQSSVFEPLDMFLLWLDSHYRAELTDGELKIPATDPSSSPKHEESERLSKIRRKLMARAYILLNSFT